MARLAGGIALIALLAGCAGGGAGPATEPARPAPADRAPSAAEVREARLAAVATAMERGRYERAAQLADSLYFRWRTTPELDELASEALWREASALESIGRYREAADRLAELLERRPGLDREAAAVRELARLRVETGDDPAAVRLLMEHPGAVDDPTRDLLRRATGSMGLSELAAMSREIDPGSPVAPIVNAALAEALALAGEIDAAVDLANRVLESDPASPEDSLAAAVRAGEVTPRSAPIRIGAILPLTGRFSQVGGWLEEGIRLALAARQERTDARPVELEILDDASDPARTPRLMKRLEERGVAAVIGPVRSEALADAGAARGGPGLLVVSPTATEVLRQAPGVFTLWDRERRDTGAARELGRWLGRAAGWRATGALYPRSEAGRVSFLAFRQGLERGGGYVTAATSYPEGETTFRDPILTLGAFEPGSVFVMSGSSSSVLQIAPQLSYFNLQAPIVVGGPEWAEPEIVRRLDPAVSQRRIVTTFVDRTAVEGPWATFKANYERDYRKALPENMLPALAHDAMTLVLEALPEEGPVRRRAVARSFSEIEAHQGATGVLSPDAATGTVAREALVRMIEDRRLVEVDPTAVRDWLENTGAVEGVRLRRRQRTAREQVEERLRELREPQTEADSDSTPQESSGSGSADGSGPRP